MENNIEIENIENIEENVENAIVVKPKRWVRGVRKSNYEYVKKWKVNNRERYLADKHKLYIWNKYRLIYMNILLE